MKESAMMTMILALTPSGDFVFDWKDIIVKEIELIVQMSV